MAKKSKTKKKNTEVKTKNALIPYVQDFFKDLVLYDDYHNNHSYKDLLEASVIQFLEFESKYTAYEVYENFFMIYQIEEDQSKIDNAKSTKVSQSNALLDLVNVLKDYEENTGDLIEKQRDHFIHSVNVFVLGLAIYSKNSRYRRIFKEYVMESPYEKYYRTADGDFSNEEFLFRWGIAALFHDIGYPVEIIRKQLAKFINDSSKSFSPNYRVDTAIDFKNFNEFNSIVKLDPNFPVIYRQDYKETNFIDVYKPTDIMAHQIFKDLFLPENVDAFDNFDKYGKYLYKLVKNLDKYIVFMGKKDYIDHGFFSAIFVLNSVGALMQRSYSGYGDMKKYSYFFYPVLNSATSILLHTYYKKMLNKDKSKINKFNIGPIDASQNPVAFLLIFCDELQEWNRKPVGIKNKEQSQVNEIDIRIGENKLDVHYIIKNSALGLNFSVKKAKKINTLLNVDSIFSEGLSVDIDLDLDENSSLENVSPSNCKVPNILLSNVEEIARLSYERYCELNDVNIEYDDLDAMTKLSLIKRAKGFSKKLCLIGCELVADNEDNNSRKEHKFSDDEIEFLGVLEHEDWCREKANTGWISPKQALDDDLISYKRYQILKNSNKKGRRSKNNTWVKEDSNLYVHGNLVPFNKLNKQNQDKSKKPYEELHIILKKLQNNPLKIVDSKIKLLSINIYDTCAELSDDKVEAYKNLDFKSQFNHLMQTRLIIKFLKEFKYALVDIEDERKAIKSLTRDQIEYLAEREHNDWYLRKKSEEYSQGKLKKLKKSPKIRPWDELKMKDKLYNLHKFENFIACCEKAGLKVIKDKKL